VLLAVALLLALVPNLEGSPSPLWKPSPACPKANRGRKFRSKCLFPVPTTTAKRKSIRPIPFPTKAASHRVVQARL